MECPCKGCEDRFVGCHSGCEAYKNWKKDLKGIRKKSRDESALYSYFNLPEHWKDHR